MKIDLGEALSYQNNGALLIDVRSEKEYLNDHIDGAINIPVNQIVEVLSICPDKNKKIIVYCSMGKRSFIAYRSLVSLGYKNVYELDYKK